MDSIATLFKLSGMIVHVNNLQIFVHPYYFDPIQTTIGWKRSPVGNIKGMVGSCARVIFPLSCDIPTPLDLSGLLPLAFLTGSKQIVKIPLLSSHTYLHIFKSLTIVTNQPIEHLFNFLFANFSIVRLYNRVPTSLQVQVVRENVIK